MAEPVLTFADLVTLTGYGLGLYWSAGGPWWAGAASIVADEVDGRLARALGETSTRGRFLDWGADVTLTPAAFGRLGREVGVGPGLGLAVAPVALLAQAHLAAEGRRPPVGSLRAVGMVAGMVAHATRGRRDGRR